MKVQTKVSQDYLIELEYFQVPDTLHKEWRECYDKIKTRLSGKREYPQIIKQIQEDVNSLRLKIISIFKPIVIIILIFDNILENSL